MEVLHVASVERLMSEKAFRALNAETLLVLSRPLSHDPPVCWSVCVYTAKSSFVVWGSGNEKHWAWIPVGIRYPLAFFSLPAFNYVLAVLFAIVSKQREWISPLWTRLPSVFWCTVLFCYFATTFISKWDTGLLCHHCVWLQLKPRVRH